MAERLTISLPDGTLTPLRELAGGERSVGKFIAELTQWLYPQAQLLREKKLSAYVLYDFDTVDARIEALSQRVADSARQAADSARRVADLERLVARLPAG